MTIPELQAEINTLPKRLLHLSNEVEAGLGPVKPGEGRLRIGLETIRNWANHKVTYKDVALADALILNRSISVDNLFKLANDINEIYKIADKYYQSLVNEDLAIKDHIKAVEALRKAEEYQKSLENILLSKVDVRNMYEQKYNQAFLNLSSNG